MSGYEAPIEVRELEKMIIVRNEQDIRELLHQCNDAEEFGTNYPGMSYEQGIKAAIEWITGDIDIHPIND